MVQSKHRAFPVLDEAEFRRRYYPSADQVAEIHRVYEASKVSGEPVVQNILMRRLILTGHPDLDDQPVWLIGLPDPSGAMDELLEDGWKRTTLPGASYIPARHVLLSQDSSMLMTRDSDVAFKGVPPCLWDEIMIEPLPWLGETSDGEGDIQLVTAMDKGDIYLVTTMDGGDSYGASAFDTSGATSVLVANEPPSGEVRLREEHDGREELRPIWRSIRWLGDDEDELDRRFDASSLSEPLIQPTMLRWWVVDSEVWMLAGVPDSSAFLEAGWNLADPDLAAAASTISAVNGAWSVQLDGRSTMLITTDPDVGSKHIPPEIWQVIPVEVMGRREICDDGTTTETSS